jgi:hypothetical protein
VSDGKGGQAISNGTFTVLQPVTKVTDIAKFPPEHQLISPIQKSAFTRPRMIRMIIHLYTMAQLQGLEHMYLLQFQMLTQVIITWMYGRILTTAEPGL